MNGLKYIWINGLDMGGFFILKYLTLNKVSSKPEI
jgi:hypothetical protein